jgi:hypothetical protein
LGTVINKVLWLVFFFCFWLLRLKIGNKVFRLIPTTIQG